MEGEGERDGGTVGLVSSLRDYEGQKSEGLTD